MAKTTRIKKIKKALMSGKIFISDHSKKRMAKRGFNNADIIRGILSGKIVEVQKGYDPVLLIEAFKFIIEGKDLHGNPIVVVLVERLDGYYIVTAMPPLDVSRFSKCI